MSPLRVRCKTICILRCLPIHAVQPMHVWELDFFRRCGMQAAAALAKVEITADGGMVHCKSCLPRPISKI